MPDNGSAPAQVHAPALAADPANTKRGRLTIERRVVEKIAGQAASEVATAGSTSGGFLGVGAHTDLSARPNVDVELTGRTASLSLELVVAYPSPIRQTTEQVRRDVMYRVEQLTGVEVTRVDITVTATHGDRGVRQDRRT